MIKCEKYERFKSKRTHLCVGVSGNQEQLADSQTAEQRGVTKREMKLPLIERGKKT